jgi:PKD repeat protein
MRPNLAIGSVERRPTAGAVDYDVTVTNRGPVAVANATVGATNGGRLVVERDLGRLAPNESTTATLRLADGAVDARLPTRLRTDPGDGLDESDESDGRRVVRPPLPDLFVPATGVTPAEEGTCDATSVDGRAICVLVGNRGSAAANATVTVTAGNASASRPVALPGTGPNGTAFRSVAVAVDALSLSAGDRATVRIRAAAPDARPVDDAVGVRITPALAGHPFASPLVAGGNRPRDPDGDGRYEDVDGDGTVGFLDVIDLLFVDWASLDEAGQRAAMDFDANGRVGFLDVVTLLFEL